MEMDDSTAWQKILFYADKLQFTERIDCSFKCEELIFNSILQLLWNTERYCCKSTVNLQQFIKE